MGSESAQQNETTQELAAEDLAREQPAGPRWPAVLAAVTFGAKTDLGRVRENNEDRFDFMEPERPEVLATRGCLYAVADGMGGHEAGQIASELALKTFFRAYYADAGSPPETALRSAVRAANSLVVDTANLVPGRQGMGTTLSAVALVQDRLWVAHVGDSRIYRLRGGSLERLTQDHSWVHEQVARGSMTPEEAQRSPYRNVILRCLGAEREVEPDIFDQPLQAGDHYLLCTDGLSGAVDDATLERLLASDAPTVVAGRLVDLANAGGGQDNITAVVLRVDALQELEPPSDEPDVSPSARPLHTRLPWWRRFLPRPPP